jgi:hypothetical protein
MIHDWFIDRLAKSTCREISACLLAMIARKQPGTISANNTTLLNTRF